MHYAEYSIVVSVSCKGAGLRVWDFAWLIEINVHTGRY